MLLSQFSEEDLDKDLNNKCIYAKEFRSAIRSRFLCSLVHSGYFLIKNDKSRAH